MLSRMLLLTCSPQKHTQCNAQLMEQLVCFCPPQHAAWQAACWFPGRFASVCPAAVLAPEKNPLSGELLARVACSALSETANFMSSCTGYSSAGSALTHLDLLHQGGALLPQCGDTFVQHALLVLLELSLPAHIAHIQVYGLCMHTSPSCMRITHLKWQAMHRTVLLHLHIALRRASWPACLHAASAPSAGLP